MAAITFYPDMTGTGKTLTDLAESLSERGTDVRVYTAQPHYYQKQAKADKEEVYKGIRIRRIPSTTLNKNRRINRILNWASFTASAFFSLLFEKTGYPLLLVTSPPTLPFAGWLLKRLRRRPFVLLVHDIWPDIGIRLGYLRQNGPTVRLFNFLNRRALESADKIVVLTDEMARVISGKMKSGQEIISVIHNWADDVIHPVEEKANLFLRRNPIPYRFLVQYAGNLGLSHPLEPLIEAAGRLEPLGVGFVFIGEGVKKEKLQDMVRRRNLKNVFFFPFQPHEILSHVLSASHLSVVALEQGAQGYGMPAKFYSILASGKPVLALLDADCGIAHCVKKYECGFVTPPGNTEKIVQIVEKCLKSHEEMKKMKENARRCFEENFTREDAIKKYRVLLSNL